jgi:acetyltransferase-like isoleucine patch superfamily enzyme
MPVILLNNFSVIFFVFRFVATFFYGFLYLARLKASYPTANIEVPCTIRFKDVNSIQLANNISIGPYSEIVVLEADPHSSIPGRLIIDSRVIIGKGANIRAAGGEIHIGEGVMLAQNVSLIGSNHLMEKGAYYMDQFWDEKKVGVKIDKNVWIGAGAIILPGVRVGENSIIGAGAVVTRDVPSGEIWAGIPAARIKTL